MTKTANCQVCHETASKYKCPKCLIRYCSLTCYKCHKEGDCDYPKNVVFQEDNSNLKIKTCSDNIVTLIEATEKSDSGSNSQSLELCSELSAHTLPGKYTTNSFIDSTNEMKKSSKDTSSAGLKLIDGYISDNSNNDDFCVNRSNDCVDLNSDNGNKNNKINTRNEQTNISQVPQNIPDVLQINLPIGKEMEQLNQVKFKSLITNNQSPVPILNETDNSDHVPQEILARLGRSDSILNLLKDTELRRMLVCVDKYEGDAASEVARLMKSQIFESFATECLKVVEM